MNCVLYRNSSDERYVDKLLELRGEIQVEYKEDTSFTNPTFIITGNYALKDINYVYIPDMSRYYYVKDIRYSKQRIYLDCHTDVIMSFKQRLRDCKAIIKRNQYKFNLYQPDERLKTLGYNSIRTLEFPRGFDFNSQHFIMGIAGSSIEEGK